LHYYGLQVYIITAAKSISKLARSQLPSAYPHSFDYGLQQELSTLMITGSKFTPSRPPSSSPKLLDPTVHEHLQTPSIKALQVHLRTSSIMASKCICKLARSKPSSGSLNLYDSILQVSRLWPPSASSNWLDYSLQVYLQTGTITPFECISKSTQSRSGETVERVGRHPIFDIPLHLRWFPKAILENKLF
jgi:hypothetical protein